LKAVPYRAAVKRPDIRCSVPDYIEAHKNVNPAIDGGGGGGGCVESDLEIQTRVSPPFISRRFDGWLAGWLLLRVGR